MDVPNVHKIVVTRNAEQLSLSQSQVHLHPGEMVDWTFEGELGSQELAFICFHSLGGPLGPFQTMEPERARIRGLGNIGIVDVYRYTAFVLNDEGVVAQSDGTATIANLSSEVNTSPSATVLCQEDLLFVTPKALQVEKGGTAIWYVQNLPPGYFVTFEFEPREGLEDGMIGPFDSLTVSRGLGDAQITIGTGFKGESPNPYPYHVQLRRPDGSVVMGEDPVIEPAPGWPPSPSSQDVAAGSRALGHYAGGRR